MRLRILHFGHNIATNFIVLQDHRRTSGLDPRRLSAASKASGFSRIYFRSCMAAGYAQPLRLAQ